MVERLKKAFGDDLRSNFILLAIIAVIYPAIYAISPGWGIVLGHGITWIIALLGFNLLFGYTGLLSFGHALFLGIGAYTAGFMYKYLGINSIELHILGSILSSAVVALAIGLVVVRYTRIFFAIFMLAIAQVFWSLYYKFYWITGGTDGIKMARFSILGISLEHLDFTTYHHIYFYFTTFLTTILIYLMWRIVNSPFGLTLKAIRDNEVRAKFIGIDIYKMRLYAFIISAIYAGITGALVANHHRLVTPDIAYWTTSGKVVFATLLGGTRIFIGPLIGSFIFHVIESFAMRFIYWQLIMGAFIIAIVILMPGGIAQILRTFVESIRHSGRIGG
ncbi:MAG: branched-chain amino acid ABC transporter permease [Aigarchaeota archaeon]|nr:branched-chain amino acid ABC transporter permease [Candidatus Geocrenenecus dongiae]